MPSPAPDDFDADDDASGTDAGGDAGPAGVIRQVALFPLPNVVLFPGAVLPLHVFERRYRAMTSDVLTEAASGGRPPLIGMCRVRPGHDPMDDQPALFEVACVGRIVHQEALPDGRFNFLLQGAHRVRVGREYPVGEDDDEREAGADVRPYRRADLHPMPSKKAFEIDLGTARERMKQLCRRPPIAGTPAGEHLEKLFAGPAPTAQLADVLAFDLLEDLDARQALLEELDERRRVEALAELLDGQFPDPGSLKSLSDRFNSDEPD